MPSFSTIGFDSAASLIFNLSLAFCMPLILRNRNFWYSVVGVFFVQFVCLLLSTPMYEIDTNSFIRGGFTWDIYHNPFLNLFIATCNKIWPNIWFMISLQCLWFAFAGSFLVHVLLGKHPKFLLLGLALLALEPLTMFYNFSLLAESFFTSFTFLSVAFMILWLRHGRWQEAALFGLAMGLTFLSKLSSMSHLPLFGLFFLPAAAKIPWRTRLQSLGLALLPFALCYTFVYLGQRSINGGDIYTVEGRVRWDFSSSQYRPEEVDGPDFKRLVDPYLFPDGQLVANRELRRELSYLGYKDCVAEYEARDQSANAGINACDSIFGAVAQQITERHFWEAEKQFIRDNVYFIHHLSYIDYRFTPGLHYYHPEHEYAYIDSVMTAVYDFNLADQRYRIPRIWTSLSFGNVYLPIWWYAWWLALIVAAVLFLRQPARRELLVLAGLTAIPLLFHLIYISYRARFFAPYLILVGLLILFEINLFIANNTQK